MPKKEHDKYPLILAILDGWGLAPENKGNAITLAKTPNMDWLWSRFPHTTLCASGGCVGLREVEDGNSEAGHMNIGAGRLIQQDAVTISNSIDDGTFFKNPAFKTVIRHIQKNQSKLHLVGMLSNGMSAHSDPEHLLALLQLAKLSGIKDVYLHLFTDGRDSPKYVAMKLMQKLEDSFLNNETVATIMGRFYGMDRKKDWQRTEMAYNALVLGQGRVANSPQDAITEAYNRGENDEFIEPYVILNKGTVTPRISDNDGIIFFNLRSDRARQLTKVFVQKRFTELNSESFVRKAILKNTMFIGMTDFGPDLDEIITAYPSIDVIDTLPYQFKDVRQLYIAETEKYAHVTYFFNGGYSGKVAGEDQYMVPSPDVKSYDETPAMSSERLTQVVLDNLSKKKYDFTVLNYAAPDMIGHTGNLQAGIECINAVDKELGKVAKAYLKAGGTVFLAADHGNIEEMINLETGEIDTEHSRNPVPFIIACENIKKNLRLRQGGILGDIAPTILDFLNFPKPRAMTGKSLITK